MNLKCDELLSNLAINCKMRHFSAALGDRAGEGAARRSLAAANQSLNDTDGAVAHLEAFLEIAKVGRCRLTPGFRS